MQEIDNLIIEHLRGLRSELKEMRADMSAEFKDIKHRLHQLETQVIAGRRDGVTVQEDVYRQQSTLDGLKERIDRIERRLELA